MLAFPSAAPAVERPTRAYALLANGQVVSISVSRGNVLAKRTIGPRPQSAAATPLLARERDTVYALTPRLGGQSVLLLDAVTLQERARIALPEGRFSALEPTRGGAIHVLGERAGAPVLVTIVDGVPRAPLELRPADGRQWRVTGAALSSDERRLAVAYQGPNATGADVIDLSTGTREPCADPAAACLTRVRGAVEFIGSALIGTTGSPDLALYRRGIPEPRAVRTLLARNRLTALARDRSSGLLLAASPCTSARGFSVIDLNRNSARAYPHACGDTVAASGRVGAIGGKSRQRKTGIALVDLRTGAQLRFVRTATPLAVAF
jgi:hypothetical protein